MPRTADVNSCLTCRRRRIRCDNRLPRCLRCEKRDVYCDRSSPLVVKQYAPESGVDLEKRPPDLLNESLIAKLFHVYIKDLAPWYDLSDETRVFERDVVDTALESPLLFSATIAFAAIYVGFNSLPLACGHFRGGGNILILADASQRILSASCGRVLPRSMRQAFACPFCRGFRSEKWNSPGIDVSVEVVRDSRRGRRSEPPSLRSIDLVASNTRFDRPQLTCRVLLELSPRRHHVFTDTRMSTEGACRPSGGVVEAESSRRVCKLYDTPTRSCCQCCVWRTER